METAEQLDQQIGSRAACRHLGVPRSRLYRARHPEKAAKPRPTPSRALTPQERDKVHQVLTSERFVDQAPRQVYATLLDEGQYLCHWRTMYRIMEQFGENRERRNQLRHPSYAKPELVATGPNQVWSWDITKLKGPTQYSAYYLYVIIDVYSRFVVGWLLAEKESEVLAHQLISQTCHNQGIAPKQLTLHADRGGPMRAKSVAQLLRDLEITKSHSRPYTPNDNPFSEAHFKTLKYQPDYPDRFASFQAALTWSRSFISYYNFDHYHSALCLLTPAVVHYGLADQHLAHRHQVLLNAYHQHPDRFVRGIPAPASLPTEVWINQPPDQVIVL